MKALIENINQILAEWDPIGVGESIAIEEYRGYIPTILKFANNKQRLMEYLANVLVNDIGLDYDSSNESHINDLQKVCEKIMRAYNNVFSQSGQDPDGTFNIGRIHGIK